MPHKASLQIRTLVRQLNDWGHAYYVQDDPKVPDATYDEVFRELQKLEAEYPELIEPDSPTRRVGRPARPNFTKHTHLAPMFSLGNAYSMDDIQAFFERAARVLGRDEPDFECVVEEKMDGLAVSLTYDTGLLTIGATRGDGEVGEDVTDNLRTIGEIPLRLRLKDKEKPPAKLEIRGEIYMDHAGFKKLNDRLEKDDQKVFANPRNAAAGSLRLLDPKLTAERPLRFFAYQIHGVELNQWEVLNQLEAWGFKVNPARQKVTGLAAIEQIVHRYEEIRQKGTLPYDIDGIVLKVNERHLVQELGAVANRPRSAIAYKLAPMEALTTIETITVQIGRTGSLTPVANLKPVAVSGVIVSRATLHNEEQIRVKDVRAGDTVWVRRAGDVIPEIVRVDLEKRAKNSKPFEMPTVCPACGTALLREKSSIYCPNNACPAKTLERLKHFCMRDAMDIRGLGDQILERLYEMKIVRRIPDIYRLRDRRPELVQLEGLGEKSIDKILAAIETSKSRGPARLLFAFGIELIGERTAEDLVVAAGSIDRLFSMSEDELLELREVGPETAASLIRASNDPAFRQELEELKELGLDAAFAAIARPAGDAGGPLKGLTFVITGTLSKPREHFRDWLRERGAAVTDSVTKNTDYLLAGEKAGSKMKKAESLGVKVVGENDLDALLVK